VRLVSLSVPLLISVVTACSPPTIVGQGSSSAGAPLLLRQQYEELECGSALLPRSVCQTLLSAMLDSVAAIIGPTANVSSGEVQSSICDEAASTLAISRCLDSLSAATRRRAGLVTSDIRQRIARQARAHFDAAARTWEAYVRAFCAKEVDSIMTGSFVAVARSACYYDSALAREAVLKRLYPQRSGD
jgi:hypothetical protein